MWVDLKCCYTMTGKACCVSRETECGRLFLSVDKSRFYCLYLVLPYSFWTMSDKWHYICSNTEVYLISALFFPNQSHFPHILLRTLIWGLYFTQSELTCTCSLTFFFFCTWNHSISSTFSSFVCYFSAVDWPKEGHVESWVHIWFDSTTCAWDSFALYIYM